MVHCRSLLRKLRHAFQHMDMESAVSEGYAEETAFEFLVCLLMPYRFLSAFLRQLTFLCLRFLS